MPQNATRAATLFVVCLAHFLMPFMVSAVGVALPAMGRDFGASAMQLGLVETAYVVSASIFLLAMGRLGDIHGRQRLFRYGLAVFTLFAGLISQAWSVEAVIGLRFLQGMGGAMVMATTMALVVSAFPPKERGKALGIAVASVYAGISCGPFIGGWMVSALGWRSIFVLCIPLGAITWVVAQFRLQGDEAEAEGEPFDWRGSVVWGVSILMLIAGASNLDEGLWAWALLLASPAGLALFLCYESRIPYPILQVGLLKSNRIFALSNLAALLNYAATFGVTFFLSLYLQFVKGMSPREAGTVLIVQPVAQTLLSPLCGRLSDFWPAARVATAGMALCAAGLGLAASFDAATSLVRIVAMLAFLGTGFALFSSPNMSVIMGSVEPRHLGVASGLSASMRTLGMMTSMIVITLVFSVIMEDKPVTPETQEAFLVSMRSALLIFAGLCVVGILFSLGRLGTAGGNASSGGSP